MDESDAMGLPGSYFSSDDPDVFIVLPGRKYIVDFCTDNPEAGFWHACFAPGDQNALSVGIHDRCACPYKLYAYPAWVGSLVPIDRSSWVVPGFSGI